MVSSYSFIRLDPNFSLRNDFDSHCCHSSRANHDQFLGNQSILHQSTTDGPSCSVHRPSCECWRITQCADLPVCGSRSPAPRLRSLSIFAQTTQLQSALDGTPILVFSRHAARLIRQLPAPPSAIFRRRARPPSIVMLSGPRR